MRLRTLTAVVAALAGAVFVCADETNKSEAKVESAQGSIVGSLACSKCNFKATEKCQTALKLDEHQFVLVSGKAGEDLFKARCSGVPKVATGALTKIDGNTVYLNVSKIVDPKTRAGDEKKADAPNNNKNTKQSEIAN